MKEELNEAIYKYCPKCDTTKCITEFHKNISRKDCLNGYCKICTRIASKKVMRNIRNYKDVK